MGRYIVSWLSIGLSRILRSHFEYYKFQAPASEHLTTLYVTGVKLGYLVWIILVLC